MLGAAFLSYSGAFNFEFRTSMLKEAWEPDLLEKKITLSQPFRLEKLLTSDV